jgi:hypothetical protein
MTTSPCSTTATAGRNGGRSPQGSKHRDGGALGTLQLAGDLVRLGGRNEAQLLHGLATLAEEPDFHRMRPALGTIGIVMLDDAADFAAGALWCSHGRTGEGRDRTAPAWPEKARGRKAALRSPCRTASRGQPVTRPCCGRPSAHSLDMC